MLGAGITHYEHIVGYHTQGHLPAPHGRPDVRIIIDMAQDRRLGTDLRTGTANPADRLGQYFGLKLIGMIEMSHNSQMLTGFVDPIEQVYDFVRIRIGQVFVRPVR